MVWDELNKNKFYLILTLLVFINIGVYFGFYYFLSNQGVLSPFDWQNIKPTGRRQPGQKILNEAEKSALVASMTSTSTPLILESQKENILGSLNLPSDAVKVLSNEEKQDLLEQMNF